MWLVVAVCIAVVTMCFVSVAVDCILVVKRVQGFMFLLVACAVSVAVVVFVEVGIHILRTAEGVGVDPGDIAPWRDVGSQHDGPWFTNAAGEVCALTQERHSV